MKFNNRNVYISPKAAIGMNVRIGDNTSVYDNVTIGNNSIIANDCVIGEPLSNYYNDPAYVNPKTYIGENALVRSHTIIYAGNNIGDNFSTGHRVTIRENCIIGKNFSAGTLTDIQGYIKAGDYCRLHSNVHIGQNSLIGNFVFIYPYVVFTNDPHPPSNICTGPSVDDYAQVAVFSVLLPGIKVGKHALIGAGSVVSKDVNDFQLVMGNPAKVIKDVRELKSRENNLSHYPWPQNFDRGMPWQGLNYDDWIANQNKY
ncbi:MAG: DapH/DapD/GlmU-related protein [Chitinophagaceae bacterium]